MSRNKTTGNVFKAPISGVRVCKWCHKKFENITGAQLANHVRWCDKNPARGKNLKRKLQNATELRMIEQFGEFREFAVKCDNPLCTNWLITVEREHKFPEKTHYFCSKHCAHSFAAQHVDASKIAAGVHATYVKTCEKNGMIPSQLETRICSWCGNSFTAKSSVNTKCCSAHCAVKYRYMQDLLSKLELATSDYEEVRLFLKRYRQACAFTFGIKSFPDEFDFSLIEKYGWYAAKNHGNNLNGVSRDHMFSVKDGFSQFVDPIFVTHPAN